MSNGNSSTPEMRSRRLVFTLIVPAFAGLLAVLLAEFSLRAAIGHLPPAALIYLHKELKTRLPEVMERIKQFNPWTQGRALDPDLGWTFLKDHLFEGTNEDGYAYRLRSSPEGFFTPDQPAIEAPQLIVLGDSFASTFYVEQPLAWVMRDKLRTPVYTLAVGGWGPETYRVAYEKFAAKRRADFVVVFSFNNDVTDVNNWIKWKETRQQISFLDWLWKEAPEQDASHTFNLGGGWLDRSSVVWNIGKLGLRRLFEIVKPAHAAAAQAQESFAGQDAERRFQLQFIRGYWFQTQEPEALLPGGVLRSYMDAYFDSLRRLRDSVRRNGAEMLLVWIPAKERVYIPLLPPERFKSYVSNRSGKLDGYERALAAFAREENIEYLDLTPHFETRAREGLKLYFTVDGHLNALGNKLAGELAADRVASMACKNRPGADRGDRAALAVRCE